MRAEAVLFAVVTAFFGLWTPVYWFLSKDPTGTTALLLTFGLGFLVAFYLYVTARRLPGPRPEDRSDAEIHEGAGELGFFSPHSWWPLALASSAAVAFAGLVFGWWLFIIGAGYAAVASVGFVFEYYRGERAQHPARPRLRAPPLPRRRAPRRERR